MKYEKFITFEGGEGSGKSTQIRLLAKKLDKDFPYVTKPDGSWDTLPASLSAGYDGDKWSHGNWFGGFWVGLLLASYLHTKDENYKKLAERRLDLIKDRSNDQNTHDIGFIFYKFFCSSMK